ncbi:TraR/DksA family transcriptional regulator [Janibacter alittae]|uniref:TraR/DksA C4-type zinc finger protein n=1 Tax=Janibacter alittae TaxID=3115209 RepID=A0ABZ2ML21_9MICO
MAAKKSTARTAAPKKSAPAQGATGTTANRTTKTAKKSTTKSASTTAKTPAKKTAASKTAASKTAAKPAKAKAPGKKAPAGGVARAEHLVVREDESPWSPEELKEVRVELEGEIARLRADLRSSENELTVFLREPIDGAGDDPADAGAKSFEREHELSLLAGARTGLEQNLHALERLEDGTYGICESCGTPIGKLRLQAYPRATLCMTCKSTQERR